MRPMYNPEKHVFLDVEIMKSLILTKENAFVAQVTT